MRMSRKEEKKKEKKLAKDYINALLRTALKNTSNARPYDSLEPRLNATASSSINFC
jgi:hypothetical protein